MGIGSAETERAHRCSPDLTLCPFPLAQLSINEERASIKVYVLIRTIAVQRRRQFAMFQREQDFDHAGNTRRGKRMADIRFNRANSAEAGLVSKATERVGQSINLDRVTELCTSAMAFDIADRLRINAKLLVDLRL